MGILKKYFEFPKWKYLVSVSWKFYGFFGKILRKRLKTSEKNFEFLKYCNLEKIQNFNDIFEKFYRYSGWIFKKL